MTIQIKNKKSDAGLIRTVETMAGVDFSRCYQCKKCSAGCPVSTRVSSPPAEIIRRLQLGAGEEILRAEIIWTCLSCETCYARCPNEINFAAAVDALRVLALEKGVADFIICLFAQDSAAGIARDGARQHKRDNQDADEDRHS